MPLAADRNRYFSGSTRGTSRSRCLRGERRKEGVPDGTHERTVFKSPHTPTRVARSVVHSRIPQTHGSKGVTPRPHDCQSALELTDNNNDRNCLPSPGSNTWWLGRLQHRSFLPNTPRRQKYLCLLQGNDSHTFDPPMRNTHCSPSLAKFATGTRSTQIHPMHRKTLHRSCDRSGKHRVWERYPNHCR